MVGNRDMRLTTAGVDIVISELPASSASSTSPPSWSFLFIAASRVIDPTPTTENDPLTRTFIFRSVRPGASQSQTHVRTTHALCDAQFLRPG